VRTIGFRLQHRQEGGDGRANVADDTQIDPAPVAQALGPQVDLRDTGVLRVELPVGEVGAQHQQRVAFLHRLVAGGEADQAGHADIERIVVFDMLLAAQRMHDRRGQRPRQLDDRIVLAGAPGAAQHGDPPGVVEQCCQCGELAIGRPHDRRLRHEPACSLQVGLLQGNVAGDHHHRHAALGDGDANGLLQDARHMLGIRDELDIVRAFAEQLLRMRFLEVGAADFGARDVRGDRQDRNAAALAVIQAVDEVEVAGAAAPRADGDLARQVSFRAGCEGRRLFMAHMDPVDRLLPAQRIGEAVQGVAGHAIDAPHAGEAQGFGHQIGNRS
jgi:hypothetical protein